MSNDENGTPAPPAVAGGFGLDEMGSERNGIVAPLTRAPIRNEPKKLYILAIMGLVTGWNEATGEEK